MNKIHRYLVPAMIAATVMPSCSDIDTYPLAENVTESQKEQVKTENPDMALAGVTGVCALFNVFNSVMDRHLDFGYPSVMLMSDSRGVDMISPNSGYNWFAEAVEMGCCNTSSDTSQEVWGICYNQIFAANAVLSGIDPATDDPTLQFFMAQALAFRAFDYLILAQTYQFTYKGHENDPCVMLITEKNQEQVAADGCLRSSVQQTYDMIMDDLNRSVSLLQSSGLRPEQIINSSPKRFVSLAVAYGLRARANLIMQNWAAAAEDAANAIASFSGSPYSRTQVSAPGFISLADNSWMWGIPVAETDRTVTSGIVNFPSHMGSLNYGYASVGAYRKVNRALFDRIPESDVRKGWFLDAASQSPNLPENFQAYVDGQKIPPFAQVKFAPYQNVLGTDNNASDIPLMRVEEMYLIQAEATAMSGNLPGGKQILEQFVTTYRDPAFSSQASSAEELQDETFFQRRVELWGEGITFYDFLRLNKDLDRRGGGWPTEWCYDVKAGSNVLRLPIPNTEVQGNEAFRTAGNNNPGAPIPSPVTDTDY